MRIGTALAMIGVGAVLRYAVTWQSSTIDIQETGTVLLVVGIVALVVALWLVFWVGDVADRGLRDY